MYRVDINAENFPSIRLGCKYHVAKRSISLDPLRDYDVKNSWNISYYTIYWQCVRGLQRAGFSPKPGPDPARFPGSGRQILAKNQPGPGPGRQVLVKNFPGRVRVQHANPYFINIEIDISD